MAMETKLLTPDFIRKRFGSECWWLLLNSEVAVLIIETCLLQPSRVL